MTNTLNYLQQLSENKVHYNYNLIQFYPSYSLDMVDFLIDSSRGKLTREIIVTKPKHIIKSMYDDILQGLDSLEYSLGTITDKKLTECIEFVIKNSLNIKGFYLREYYNNCKGHSEQEGLFRYVYQTGKIKLQIKNIKDNTSNIGYYFE